MPLKLNSSGGGSVTLDTPTTALAYTVTLPTSTSTLATTNGTLTNPTINGFTGDTSVINVGSGQFYKDASGNVGIGTTSTGGYRVAVVGSAASSVPLYLNTDATNSYLYSPNPMYVGSTGASQLAFVTSNTERSRIDSAGRFTTPFQPRFSGYRTDAAPNWFGSSAVAVFVANNALVNVGNCYNTSTGVFTCPVAGNYRICFAALVGNIGWGMLYYSKNGVTSIALSHGNPNGAALWYTMGYDVIVSCAANDTLSAAFNTSGAGYVYNSTYNYVTIELIG
jgi:hypothetical protein